MTDLAPVLRQELSTKPNLGFHDFCSKEGAEELKRRIEHFWDRKAKRNSGAVKLSIEKMICHSGRSSTGTKFQTAILHCVRSNLIRGLPP